jgi:hypothetical protein
LLFILAMEVLSRLFAKAQEEGVLRGANHARIKFQCSIYADDVILFAHPDEHEANAIKEILAIFGEASGLQTNLGKCSVTEIFGAAEHIEGIRDILQCQVLGFPLSTSKIPKAEIRKTVDAVARRLPACHGPLMAKSGRLIWIKSVLSAVPIYCMIADGLPPWARNEIDSICRKFLWTGKDGDVRGKCMLAWETCTRPKKLGGLGITDMRLAGYAFEAKWLWLQKTDVERAWAELPLQTSPEAVAFFRASTYSVVGSGTGTRFWIDNWIGGTSIQDMAPTLVQFIPNRVRQNQTVAEALPNRAWIQQIRGGMTMPAIAEYLCIWHLTQDIVLNETPLEMDLRWEILSQLGLQRPTPCFTNNAG